MKLDKVVCRSYPVLGAQLGTPLSSAAVTGKDKMYRSHPARDVMGLIQAELQRKREGWENY